MDIFEFNRCRFVTGLGQHEHITSVQRVAALVTQQRRESLGVQGVLTPPDFG